MIALFFWLPMSRVHRLRASRSRSGLLWLSTVPPTNGIVAQIFGVRYLAMLSGFTFFSHQIGSFLGAWLGGKLYDTTGSYDVVWWIVDRARHRRRADQPADRRARDPSGRRAARRRNRDRLTAGSGGAGGSESARIWSTASVMIVSTPHAASSATRAGSFGV